jgi:hypothetical protein
MLTVLLVMLAVMFVVSMPTWRHSRSWGYVPSSSVGIALLVVIVLMLSGRL